MAKTDFERDEGEEEGLEGTQCYARGVKCEGEMSHMCGAVWGAYGTPSPEVVSCWRMLVTSNGTLKSISGLLSHLHCVLSVMKPAISFSIYSLPPSR